MFRPEGININCWVIENYNVNVNQHSPKSLSTQNPK